MTERRDDDCLFCKIIAGEVPATILHETEGTVVFRDIAPQAPEHVLIVPRSHYPDVGAVADADGDLLVEFVRAAHQVAVDRGVEESGWRLVFNTGPDSGQVVFHCHAHVVGGRRLGPIG
jgi:histidine triad (HIT) family protein